MTQPTNPASGESSSGPLSAGGSWYNPMTNSVDQLAAVARTMAAAARTAVGTPDEHAAAESARASHIDWCKATMAARELAARQQRSGLRNELPRRHRR